MVVLVERRRWRATRRRWGVLGCLAAAARRRIGRGRGGGRRGATETEASGSTGAHTSVTKAVVRISIIFLVQYILVSSFRLSSYVK